MYILSSMQSGGYGLHCYYMYSKDVICYFDLQENYDLECWRKYLLYILECFV